jgi:tRNA dimethylallyltransferase
MNTYPIQKTLIVVAGPTASGKTVAAIQLARYYNTVVISADSRQFFREMTIGTAKPTADELAAVPHYFINSHSVTKLFSVGDFERDCIALLNKLFVVHDTVILAGGSGLYIKAVTEGFDEIPDADMAIRDQLNAALALNGIEPLQEQLKEIDPSYYDEADINNPQRVIRALEVYESTGKPFSSYRTSKLNKRPFNIVKIGLNMPRERLYDRINMRVDNMIKDGLIEEAAALMPYRQYNALNTVGYSELFDYFDGLTDKEAAIASIKQNTRRFAKRQLTWFRKDNEFVWFDASNEGLVDEILRAIKSKLSANDKID